MRASLLVSKLILVAVLVFFLLGSESQAGPEDPGFFSDLELDVICDVTAPTLIQVQMSIGTSWDGRVQGMTVERSVVGTCGPPLRLNTITLGALQVGEHWLQWTDDTAVYGVAYRYRAIGIDADGHDLPYFWPSFEMSSSADFATCGNPVIAHGILTTAIAPGLLEVCVGGCWSTFTIDPFDPLVAQYVDTGIPVRLVGSVNCTLGNVEGCSITVTQVTEAPCPEVATEQGSWGALKARF